MSIKPTDTLGLKPDGRYAKSAQDVFLVVAFTITLKETTLFLLIQYCSVIVTPDAAVIVPVCLPSRLFISA